MAVAECMRDPCTKRNNERVGSFKLKMTKWRHLTIIVALVFFCGIVGLGESVRAGRSNPNPSALLTSTRSVARGGEQQADDVTLVSWYTASYADHAATLTRSCQRYGVVCDIVQVPDAVVEDVGSFQAFKVLFILAKLLEHGGQVMYVDADLELKAPLQPKLLSVWSGPESDDTETRQKLLPQPDAAVFNWRYRMTELPPTIATGAIYLRDTHCTRQLLRLWAHAMMFDTNAQGAADDRILSFLFEELYSSDMTNGVVRHLGLGRCSFAWLPATFLHLPTVPAFTRVFGKKLTQVVLTHPHPVTASFRNSQPPIRPPTSFYNTLLPSSSATRPVNNSSIHQNLKEPATRRILQLALSFLSMAPPPPPKVVNKKLNSGDFLSQEGIGMRARIAASMTALPFGDSSVHSESESANVSRKLVVMFDVSPQEQFGKVVRALSVVVSQMKDFAQQQTSNPLPGGPWTPILVVPNVRCLRPLRYVNFRDIVDLEHMATAVGFDVLTIEQYVDQQLTSVVKNVERHIPVLFRSENKRCDDHVALAFFTCVIQSSQRR
mgnify:CR=1 FL=1